MPFALTSVDRVKEWAEIKGNEADALLARLIQNLSTFVRSNLPNVALDVGSVTEIYDGNGQTFMLLRQKPVLSVTSIEFPSVTLSDAGNINPYKTGFMLQEIQPPGIQQRLDLIGYVFPRGRGNVRVTYRAGYMKSGEATVIDSGSKAYTAEFFMSDQGVKFSDGTALTKVALSPLAGQYSVDDLGVYTFNAADQGRAILLSYGYCPADIVGGVTEFVGERYKAKGGRIGITGQTVGGRESVTYFTQKDMSAFVQTMFMSYISNAPV